MPAGCRMVDHLIKRLRRQSTHEGEKQLNASDYRISYSRLSSRVSPMGRNAGGQTPVPQSSDPRRSSNAPRTPLQTPMSPGGAGSTASGSQRIDRLGAVSLRLDHQDYRFDHLVVTRGAMPGQQPDGDAVLAQVLGSGGKRESIAMQEVDLSLVYWQMRFGARVAQWAKVGSPPHDAVPPWNKLKTASHAQGKVCSRPIQAYSTEMTEQRVLTY